MTTTTQHTHLLPVMESFYTLQGEGYYAGTAAYFIRLAGCNVGCVWCDVKESWNENQHPKFTVEQILNKIHEEIKVNQQTNNKAAKPIVVITGGEPLQHNLTALTTALQQQEFQVNIETSGTAPLTGTINWICLSPKKFKAPLPSIIPLAHELKIIVFNKTDFDWAEQYAAMVNPNCKLYLQPEWDKRDIVTPLIVDYIKANPKWQLSLQIHKYINVP